MHTSSTSAPDAHNILEMRGELRALLSKVPQHQRKQEMQRQGVASAYLSRKIRGTAPQLPHPSSARKDRILSGTNAARFHHSDWTHAVPFLHLSNSAQASTDYSSCLEEVAVHLPGADLDGPHQSVTVAHRMRIHPFVRRCW